MGEEASAQCQTGFTVLLGTVCEPLIHLMEGPLMVPFLVLAVAASHGVEVVAEYSVAGEGSVVGDNKKIVVAWGPSMEPNPLTPLGEKGDLAYR